MDRKDRLDSFGISALVFFALVFAFNQVVVKVTVEGISPVFTAALRSLFGVGAVLLWTRWRGIHLRVTRAQFLSGLLVGGFFTAEFICIFIALDITTVSRASVLFYTMPIWLGMVAHFALPDERLTGLRLLGFLVAIAGIVIAFWDGLSSGANVWGDILALAAALLWAAIALTVRLTPISETPAEVQLIFQLGLSALVYLLIAPLFGPILRDPQAIHWAGIAFQSIVTVLLGYLLWFSLMKVYPASDIAAYAFLSPVFSVILGWWLLGEEIGPQIILALVLVCLGLVLISRRK